MIEFTGQVTITSTSSGDIVIKLEDGSSGIKVTEIKMKPEDFALSSIANRVSPCRFTFVPDAPVGKTREVKEIQLPLPDVQGFLSREDKKDLVLNHFSSSYLWEEGWSIFSDGTSVQQNKAGVHTYLVHRYI